MDVRSIVRVLGVGGLLVCLFLIAFRIVPIPAGTDAITLCFPLSGPIQRFRSDLEPHRRAIVEAHEAVHAAQCRRLGSIKYVLSSRKPRERLSFEAEAFCAEMRVYVEQGADAALLSEEVVNELYSGYGHKRTVSKTEIRELLRASCSDLVPKEAFPARQ